MLAKILAALTVVLLGIGALLAPPALDQPPPTPAQVASPAPLESALYLAPPSTTTTTTVPEKAPPPVSRHETVVVAQGAVTPTTVVASEPTPGSEYQRFERLADCETGDRYQDAQGRWNFVEGTARWGTNTGNGYTGGLQFTDDTWHRAGGTGSAYQHTKDEQIAIAINWLHRTSWAQWPWCSRQLGYR